MPGQDRGRERRRPDAAVLDDEDVLARAVGDEAVVREQDRLVVARALCLVDRQHRVEVHPGRLGDVRDRVRADALPGRDHRADAVRLVVVAEVVAPRPAHDHHVDGVALGVHAQLAVAVERERAHVALRQPVAADQLVRRCAELVGGERQVHVKEARRVVEPYEVLAKPEDGRAVGCLVAADALEHAGAVVQAVRPDVDLGVGPVDELTVHPDRLGLAASSVSFRG